MGLFDLFRSRRIEMPAPMIKPLAAAKHRPITPLVVPDAPTVSVPVCGTPYAPGSILHEAIVGAFRASGSGFESWCADNAITPSAARSATFGQSRGPKGRALLARMIAEAGPDIVRAAYMARLKSHVTDLKDGVA